MSKEQQVQEEGYVFPYHFLPHMRKGVFNQARVLEWGYEYQSYLDFLVGLIRKKEFKTLLDVGCGDGRLINDLHRALPEKKLVGTDYSSHAIEFAKVFNRGGKFVVGDITNRQLFSTSFDIITLIETLEHIEPSKIDSFIAGIAHHLSDDGLFIITVPSTTRAVNAKHYQHFTLETLKQSVASEFEVVEYYFLNKVGWVDYLIKRLLSNRFFILNEKHLLKFLYAFYSKNMLHGAPEKTQRICVVCRKKG